MGIWIGVDTGGTFTDLVAYAPDAGTYYYLKLPSTPQDPAKAILDGIGRLLEQYGWQGTDVGRVAHGTTLGTNALLEGKLPRTGLITTDGFRDVLELARQRRPHLFDLRVPKPDPIVPRDRRLEARERMSETGKAVIPLHLADVEDAARQLKESGCEAVAVCFLHSYANRQHESRAADVLDAVWPDAYVSLSSEVLSEMREYERFATTVVNASLRPVIDRYLARLESGLAHQSIPVAPRIMQSNGGAVAPSAVRRVPVNTFFSGPAAGVIAATRLGQRAAQPNLLTFDMGGTSTDVCLIENGAPAMQIERRIGGLPVRTRTLDIHTVGAGGGSIGWVDAGGLLKVGPQSAGADPGPAAYGHGGSEPTVTDANLVLGRLAPADLLDGAMACDPSAADRAIERIAGALNLTSHATAAGILRIVNVNMIGALRVVSVERGRDPRDFALVAFGGAGPLHAAEIAEQMGIRQVIVPAHPGLASALGLLEADARADFSLTQVTALSARAQSALTRGFSTLYDQAMQWLAEEGIDLPNARIEWQLDARYLGQSFEIGVPLPSFPPDGDMRHPASRAAMLADIPALAESFHARHEHLNGYASRDHGIEVVTLRLAAVAPQIALAPESTPAANAKGQAPMTRDVWFANQGSVETPIFHRDALSPRRPLSGPAVVRQMDATTLVPPGHTLRAEPGGHLIIETPHD